MKRATAPDAAGPAVGTRLSAAEIHDNVLLAADAELGRPAAELFWSALDAGLAIGFSFLAAAYLSSLVAPAFRTAVAAAGYPLGFVFVVLARSQLFTENTLEPVIPLLNRRDRTTAAQVARLWAIVLIGNLLGALAFALVAAHTPMAEPTLRDSLGAIATQATGGGFALVAYRGVFAGWLVGLMAWLVASTRATGAQIALVWLTTAPIGAFGFAHGVAGAVEAFYRASTGDASWSAMLGSFIVPALLGNIAGGVLLVALLNYGQVSSRTGWRAAGAKARRR